MTLVLRNVRPWGGALTDVEIADGLIERIGGPVRRVGREVDGCGNLLLPGLHDHHLHILALAARRSSVDLAGLDSEAGVRRALAEAPPSAWVRAVGYDERIAGIPDAAALDGWMANRPVRLADRTGALRVLNSAALALLAGKELPPGAERDSDGKPTGRFWREDQWLATALPQAAPDVAALGKELASCGLTSLTDAGAHNGSAEAAMLAGVLPQRLTMMGSEALLAGVGYTLGPLKLLIDERDPPDPATLAGRIDSARTADRPVAAHCVTEAELLLYLDALEGAGGALAGDRIEHGGLIPVGLIEPIAAMGLTVVTNPAFIHDRGDRYRATVAPEQWDDLYRAASLASAGIPVLAGSDAPYADVDPWLGMRTARDRRTAKGRLLGEAERLDAKAALRLYAGGSIAPGAPADLILCEGRIEDILADLSAERVMMTVIGGEIAFARNATAII